MASSGNTQYVLCAYRYQYWRFVRTCGLYRLLRRLYFLAASSKPVLLNRYFDPLANP
jgi:hypothetical protein